MYETSLEEWEVISAYEITRFVSANGFENINGLELFETGKPYCCRDGKLFVRLVHENVRKYTLDTTEKIAVAARLTGNFHKLSRGFEKPPGIRIKTEWGRFGEKYKLMLIRLRRFYKNASLRDNEGSQFYRKAMACRDKLLYRAEISETFFKSNEYLQCLEASMRKKEVGICSLNESTFVDVNGTIMLSPAFDAAYNMAVEDLARLIRKCCEKTGGNKSRGVILAEYRKIIPIEQSELHMIDAMMDFPSNCIKYILKYQDNPSKATLLLEKLDRSCEMELEGRPWRRESGGI